MTQLVSVLEAKSSDWKYSRTGCADCDVKVWPKLGAGIRSGGATGRQSVLFVLSSGACNPPAPRANPLAQEPHFISIKIKGN